MVNADPAELEKFGKLAHRWWDPEGEFRPLHEINPLRLDWIAQHAQLEGSTSSTSAAAAASSPRRWRAAARTSPASTCPIKPCGLRSCTCWKADYRSSISVLSAEDLAAAHPGEFDVVTCMELLEHVPDPAGMVAACARLVRPGGQVFFSTINRNPKAYLFAVVGAEYVLGLLPKGTHDYQRFIKPSELSRWSRGAGLRPDELIGMTYNPITRRYRLGRRLRRQLPAAGHARCLAARCCSISTARSPTPRRTSPRR